MDNIVKLGEAKAKVAARLAPDRQQMAEHVAKVSFELSEMVTRAEMPFLKHLLDMTTEEAMQQGYMPRRGGTDTH